MFRFPAGRRTVIRRSIPLQQWHPRGYVIHWPHSEILLRLTLKASASLKRLSRHVTGSIVFSHSEQDPKYNEPIRGNLWVATVSGPPWPWAMSHKIHVKHSRPRLIWPPRNCIKVVTITVDFKGGYDDPRPTPTLVPRVIKVRFQIPVVLPVLGQMNIFHENITFFLLPKCSLSRAHYFVESSVLSSLPL